VSDGIGARARRVAGLLALALLACASPGSEVRTASAPSPALWRAEAPGRGTLYLLGSVHMGPGDGHRFGGTVDRAWERSEELVVEVDVSRVSQVEQIQMTRLYGMLQPPTTLREVVSGATWGQLAAYLQLRGIRTEEVAGYKPWFVAFTVVQIELQEAGYDAAQGVDRAFIDAAAGDGKPIAALETAASQLQMMDRLPASLQELMLRDSLARVDRFPEDTAELVDAWRRGDEQRLEKLVFQPLDEFPELELFYDLVFFQRNQVMASELARLSEDGRTRFVVLGAGHMIGAQGVPRLLAQRGYRVERQR
jgi:uncharacterized protein YbaP (TraB family)